jgi:hypothetical protein
MANDEKSNWSTGPANILIIDGSTRDILNSATSKEQAAPSQRDKDLNRSEPGFFHGRLT